MKINIVGVIGAGVMGQGIAQLAAQSGLQTFIFDAADGQAKLACENVDSSWDKLEQKGKFTSEKIEKSKSLLNPAQELYDLKDCDLIIEAIVENLEIKQSVFKELEEICEEDTILCSNTSSLSITALSNGLKRPENFAGLHFFNPAPIMKLVEIIPTHQSSSNVIQSLKDCTFVMNKISVQAKDSPGFIVNRCARPFYSEALVMLEEQIASVEIIDKCIQSGGGFPLGPFQLIDLVGLDINLKATETIWNAFDQHDRFKPSDLLREKYIMGQLGRKSGQGFYDYSLKPKNDEPLTYIGDDIPVVELAKSIGLDFTVAQSGAKTAEEISKSEGRPVLVLDRLSRPFECDKPAHLTCASAGMNADDQSKLVHVFETKGINLHFVKDRPGLIIARLAAALLNEATAAKREGVASAEDIDISLKAGLNFTFGPFEMAEAFGLDNLKTLQQNLYQNTGRERYFADK